MLPPHSGDAGLPHGSPAPNGNGNGHGELVPVLNGPLMAAGSYFPPGGAVARPELLTARPDPLSLARALRRRWVLGSSLAVIVGSAAAALAWMFLPMGYEVAAWVQVSRMVPTVLGKTATHDAKEADAFRQTQTVMVKSPIVLLSALRADNYRIRNLALLRSEPDKVRWLENNLLVGFRGESDVMTIAMRDDYPEQMVEIVNAVTNAYLDEVVHKQESEKRGELQTLENQLTSTNKSIADRKDQLHRIMQSAGATDPEAAAAKEQIALHRLHGLQQSKTLVENELRDVQTVIHTLKIQEAIAKDPEKRDAIIDEYLEGDPQVQSLRQDLFQLQKEMKRMSKTLRPGRANPAAAALGLQLQSMQQDIQELKESLRPRALQKFELQTLDAITTQLKVEAVKYASLQDHLKQIQQQYDEQAEEVQKIRNYNGEVERLRGELEPLVASAERLAQEIYNRQLDLRLPARVQLIELADKPEGLSYLVRYTLVAFFGLGGFGLTLLGFSYREFLDRRIQSATQISDGLGMRVMGALPDLTSRLRKRAAGGDAMLSGLMSESIDSVRTMLMHSARTNQLRLVMVTSAVEQEGKSTVASQLAASLARCGRKTLLVDGDLRRPSAHLLFDLANDGGLAEVLRGDAELEEVIQPTQAPELWLLPAGHCDFQCLQMLARDDVGEVFDKLRNRFDFVIVDSGPVLAFADSLLIGQHLDAAILAVLRDVSRAPRVYEAYERLTSVNIEVLGAVVSGETPYISRRRLPLQLQEQA